MPFLQIWVQDDFCEDFREDSKVYLIESQAADPAMECMAAQRSLEGDYVRWVRDSCLRENRFVCERPQTYAAEKEQGLN